MPEDERNWGVFDTWQGRWCPRHPSSYYEASKVSELYNEREEIGSKRYVAKRHSSCGTMG